MPKDANLTCIVSVRVDLRRIASCVRDQEDRGLKHPSLSAVLREALSHTPMRFATNEEALEYLQDRRYAIRQLKQHQTTLEHQQTQPPATGPTIDLDALHQKAILRSQGRLNEGLDKLP